jgi:hypothetical protein
MTAPIASGWSKFAGQDSHPLRNAAFARRTPQSDIPRVPVKVSDAAYSDIQLNQERPPKRLCENGLKEPLLTQY